MDFSDFSDLSDFSELRLIANPIHLVPEKIHKNETIDTSPKLSDYLCKKYHYTFF